MIDGRTREGSPSVAGDGGARRLMLATLLALATVLALAGPLAPKALAQGVPTDPAEAKEAAKLNCEDVATQRGAQALFKISKEDRFGLDRNGDGVACETAPSGKAEDGTALGTETGGDLDCMDFSSQKAAQARLREDPSDPYKLDPEHNGVACDIRPTDYADHATDFAPVAGSRSEADLDCDDFEFRQEAQVVYHRDPSDPNGLDGPSEEDARSVGNGLACETLPLLASNVENVVAKGDGAKADGAKAVIPASLVAAWPRVWLGLLLDLAALLLVTGGALTLLVAARSRRSSGRFGR